MNTKQILVHIVNVTETNDELEKLEHMLKEALAQASNKRWKLKQKAFQIKLGKGE